MTALHLAVKDDCVEIVKILLRKGAQPEIKDNHGNTSLHLAFKNYRRAIARLLLENGSDTSAQDTNGDTVLHFAVEKNRKNFVELLLEKSDDNLNELKFKNAKDCLSVKNNAGQTPTALVEAKYRKNPKHWESINNDIVTAIVPVQGLTRNVRDDSEETGAPPTKKLKISDSCNRSHSRQKSAIGKTLHGIVFQTKLTMSFIRIANEKKYDFYIGSEVTEAGDFDDIVMQYKSNDDNWQFRFFQAKHRMNPTKRRITVDELIKQTEKSKTKKSKTNDDFSLLKYFRSFCKIIANPLFEGSNDLSHIKDVVLITNTDFDFEEKSIKHKKDRNPTKIGPMEEKRLAQNLENRKWKNYFKKQYVTNEDEFLYIKDRVETHTFKEEFYEEIIEEIKTLDRKEMEPTMGNVNRKIRKFLEKLVFVINYPSETELDHLIELKLGEDFSLFNANSIKNSFHNEIIDFIKFNDEGKAKFYTPIEGKVLYEKLKAEINTIVISGSNEAYKADNLVPGCDFNVEDASNLTVQKMRSFLSCNEKHILHLKTECTQLSATKISQLLETIDFKRQFEYLKSRIGGFIFTDAKKFLALKLLFQSSFFSNKGPRLLVFVCPFKYDQSEFVEILNFCTDLMKHRGRKAILIDQSEFDPSNVTLRSNMDFIKDEISFSHLTSESQSKIFDKNVLLHGKSVQLKQLLSVEKPNEIFNSSSVLLHLLTEKEFAIGSNEPFRSVTVGIKKKIYDIYIERNLQNQWVKDEILKENVSNVLFFITGKKLPKFNKLGVENKFVHNWVDGKEYSNGIVCHCAPLDGEDMYRKLCSNNRRKCIYWLECRIVNPSPIKKENGKKSKKLKDYRFYWRAFHGNDASVVHKYVQNKIDRSDGYFKESCLVGNTQRVVIIANDPGFGKSALLTSLAIKIKNQTVIPPWIVRIDLNKYIMVNSQPSLNNINFDANTTANCLRSAISFVSSIAVPNEKNLFERKLFEVGMQHHKTDDSQTEVYPRLVILFDGFDEINPVFNTKTTNMIKALLKTHIAQIFISTRNSEKTHLENEFSSPSFTLGALSESDQITFLARFWRWLCTSRKTLNESGYRPIIPEDSKRIRRRRNTNIDKKIEKKDQKYSKLAKEFIVIVNNTDKSSKHDNANSFSLNEIPLSLQMMAELVHRRNFDMKDVVKMTDIVMYEEIIKASFDYYKNRKRENLNASYKLQYDLHYDLAVKQIFPEVKTHSSKKLSDEGVRNALVEIGLLKPNLEFIHRIYAEYFVAEYLANNLHEENAQQILENILFNRMFANISKFFEHNLKPENFDRMKSILEASIVRLCTNEETKQLAPTIATEAFDHFLTHPKNFQLQISKDFVRFAVVKIPKDKPEVIQDELVTHEKNLIGEHAFYKKTYERGKAREIA